MDRFDAELLNLVQLDNRLTAAELSEKVGLSPSACQRRLRYLRETGVIEKDVSIIAPEKVGQQMTMIVEVSLEREQPDLIDQFKRTMAKQPEVMQCYYVTGDADFILVVTAKNMQDYEEFSRRCFQENLNIRRFQTNVVMDRVKTGFFIPVEEAEEFRKA